MCSFSGWRSRRLSGKGYSTTAKPYHHNLFAQVGVLLLRFGDGSLREVDASQEGHVNGVIALLPPPGRQSGQLRSSSHKTATAPINICDNHT